MSGNHWIRWTKEEEQELCRLYAEGVPFAELAERFGRKPSALRQKCKTLGIRRDPEVKKRLQAEGRAAFYADPAKRAQWVRRKREAVSPEQVAKLVERNRCGRWNKGRSHNTTPEHRQKLRAANYRRWAREIGLPPGHPLRDDYHRWVAQLGAAEARRIIAEEIARLPKHERQIIKLQLGQARIIGR